jgi:transcriptional regulator of acetoin/glycerol metabolism
MERQRSDVGPDLDPGLHDLFEALRRRASAAGGGAPRLRAWIEQAETWRILDALREAGGNRSAAARALGIGRRTLYTKMERLGIHPVWEGGRDGNGARLRLSGPP